MVHFLYEILSSKFDFSPKFVYTFNRLEGDASA